MRKITRSAAAVFSFPALPVMAALMSGCQSPGPGPARAKSGWTAKPETVVHRPRSANAAPLRRVVCLYDQRPWLNLDRAGDRDPEGIRYRVFLVAKGATQGEHRNGIFHVEMYKIHRQDDGTLKRELVSDWHYPAEDLPIIADPGMLGDGYYLHLRWARKDLAGSEVEIITQFELPNGNRVRSGTKRLRVPDYLS